jgi:hypothetical protein
MDAQLKNKLRTTNNTIQILLILFINPSLGLGLILKIIA